MSANQMTCGHPAEVELSWNGFKNQLTLVRACECCAAMIWDRLSQPLRETFSIRELEPEIVE